MKKLFICSVCVFLSAVFSLSACSYSKKGSAESLNDVIYDEKGSGEYVSDAEYLSALNGFSADVFSISAEDQTGNYVMSPLSAYFALSMLYDIADRTVKTEIETLFGMTADQIALTGKLFLSLVNERVADGKQISKLNLTNSVWLSERALPNKPALNRLAEELFCHAYKAPFSSDNKAANNAIREFIKKQTKGLIDKDFDLSPQTLFALINTLYFKDVWLVGGDLASARKDFYADGNTVVTDFLTGQYFDGQTTENDVCEFFYTETYCGYKLKLILPKDEKTLEDVCSAENLAFVNGYKSYISEDAESRHITRCIFPAFKITADTKLKDILENNGYLATAFSAFMNDLTGTEIAVSDIKHTATLNVDKTGIEGAAVTIIETKETSAGPQKPPVYHDFIVNRPFAFTVTTKNNVVLFTGIVKDPAVRS